VSWNSFWKLGYCKTTSLETKVFRNSLKYKKKKLKLISFVLDIILKKSMFFDKPSIIFSKKSSGIFIEF